ncbi:hypothetical protein ACLOAV_004483 [Pseudogymnoascus australis]
MASLQRAVLMLRKLNLSGIPREIRESLRELQDVYSERLDFGGDSSSDTSNESDVESAEGMLHERLGGKEAPRRLKGGHAGIHWPEGEKGNSHETESGDAEHGLEKDMGNKLSNRGGRGERRGFASDTTSTLQKDEDGEVTKYGCTSGSRLWKWGPGATSKDATVFFQRVV